MRGLGFGDSVRERSLAGDGGASSSQKLLKLWNRILKVLNSSLKFTIDCQITICMLLYFFNMHSKAQVPRSVIQVKLAVGKGLYEILFLWAPHCYKR